MAATPDQLAVLCRDALWLATMLSLPLVGAAALVGLLVALFQASTQLQDATLAHLPRWLVVTGLLALLGPWMGRGLLSFALRAWVGH